MTLRQWWCGYRSGHAYVIAHEGKRKFMRCAACGHETAGIVITGSVRKRFEGDPQRHRLKPRLVLKKRA